MVETEFFSRGVQGLLERHPSRGLYKDRILVKEFLMTPLNMYIKLKKTNDI